MIDREAESQKLVAIIKRDSQHMTQSMLQDLLQIAGRWKPAADFDGTACDIRRYYEGDSIDLIRAQLQKAFPKTWHKMLPVGINVVRHLADQAASVYDDEPERSVYVGDSEEPDEAKTEEIREVFKKARARSVMPEAERRVVSVRNGAIRVGVDHFSECVTLEHFWPDDYFVIPHPAAPYTLALAKAFIARVVGPGGNEEARWFEVWTREIEDDESGLPERVGRWRRELVCEDGDRSRAFGSGLDEYEGERLPWVLLTDGVPQGSPYLPIPKDGLSVQEATNQLWTDQLFGRRMQAHPILRYAGNQKSAPFVGGPADVVQIGEGEGLDVLDFPVNDSLMDTAERLMRTHAVLNRISPDSASTDAAPSVQTGIARVIQNLPQTEARKERVAYWKDTEEHHLMPIMAEVSDLWLGTRIGAPNVSYRVEFSEPENYEDPEAKQRRVMEQLGEGLITKARAAVELGLYGDEAEAEKAIGGQEQRPAAPVFSLRDRLAAVSNAQPEEAPGEDDEPEVA